MILLLLLLLLLLLIIIIIMITIVVMIPGVAWDRGASRREQPLLERALGRLQLG